MQKLSGKRTLNRSISVILSLLILFSSFQGVFASPFADEEDNWKFMRLKALPSQTAIAVSQYFSAYEGTVLKTWQEGKLYQVYNPTQIDTELSFRQHQGQFISLELWDVTCTDPEDIPTLEDAALNEFKGYLYGTIDPGKVIDVDGSFITDPPKIGPMALYNVYASGYSGEFRVDNDTPPDMSIENIVTWNGMVSLNDGSEPFYLETEGAHVYAIVIQPMLVNNAKYRSYMGIIHDYDSAVEMLGFDPNQYEYLWADPVNVINGNLIWQYTDLEIYGRNNLSFGRTYNSQDDYNGALGYGWRHSFEYKLEDKGLSVDFSSPDGFSYAFELLYGGRYNAPEGSGMSLSKNTGGFTLIDRDNTVYEFDLDGNILSYTTLNGDKTSYSYSAGNLSSISNMAGTISFEYSGGHIVAATTSDGRRVTYGYSGDDLTSFRNTDGDQLQYVYDGDHNLLTVRDFNGDIYLQNTYADGRVATQYLAGEGTSYFSYDLEARITTITAP
ncbi:MAG: DUF6531 domain-containing protein, partial [Clostridiales bacterium]|nr:DUF6531 domain-containing protein [Clostridiales bacterium]